jgi:antitoxin (DNA-binding transcriptional repressor) of toxin-antitoxin stability system
MPSGRFTGPGVSGQVRETCYPFDMRTLSVRDLRQRWPEAEARLRVEREIVITRDSKPVAKLVRIDDNPKRRKRFDPITHAKWQRRVGGGRVARWVDRALDEARRDRRLLRGQA